MDFESGFGGIIEALPDGIIISTSDGRIVHVNARVAELTGYPAGDLVGRRLEELVVERQRDAYRNSLEGYEEAVGSMSLGADPDLALCRADGREVHVDLAVSTLSTPEVSYVLTSLRDVTGRFESDALLRAAVEVNDALLAGRDSDDILRLVCRHARSIAQADLATIAAPVSNGVTLTIRVAEGEHAHRLEGMVFPPEQSISGTVIKTGHAEIIDDTSADERFYQPVVSLGEIGPAVIVPLSARGHAFGTILVANRRGRVAFNERDLRLVETFGAQAAITLEYARAQQELRRLMVFEDRERIARDLHDTVIQRLFATGMSLQSVIDHVPEAVSDRIGHAIDELDTTIREIRSTIFALETARRRGKGIRSDVLGLAAESARGLGYEPHVRFDGAIDSTVPEHVAENLLSTLSEALSNVARHAHSTKAEIHVTLSDGILHLQISDDGVGIPPTLSRRGLGLRNMGERAQALGGSLELSTPSQGGSVLDWQVPINSSA